MKRRYRTPTELAALPAPALTWPAVSIGFLCFSARFAPPAFISALNAYLLLLVGLCWVASQRPHSPPRDEQPLLWAVLPFAAALLVGLLGGLGADRYLVLKDAWYYANPAMILAVGYVLARLLDDPRRGLRAFVVGGSLVALLHVLIFALHPDLLAYQATQIRGVAGTGYYAAAAALILLAGWWGRWREGLLLPPFWAGAGLLLCTASVVLSFSRTMSVVVVVGLLAMAGFLVRREWLRVGAAALAGVLALLALNLVIDTSSTEAKRSFLGKLARSVDELEMRDFSRGQIDDNWRGYETHRAVQTWSAGGPWQQVVGRGFGAQVDLGLFQNLSRNPRDAVRFIPVLHNGYAYVLVKTGLVGIALYLAALGWLYSVGRRQAQEPGRTQAALQGRALQACVAVLLVTSWVVSGVFNKFDLLAFTLLAGFLLAACTPHAGRRGGPQRVPP